VTESRKVINAKIALGHARRALKLAELRVYEAEEAVEAAREDEMWGHLCTCGEDRA
jgi:hypothetical protein